MKTVFTFLLFCLLSSPLFGDHLSSFELIQELSRAQNFNGAFQGNLQSVRSLKALEEAYQNESFFTIQQGHSAAEINGLNARVGELLQESASPPSSPNTVNSINQTQARELYRALTEANVTQNEQCYARPGVSLGFCFGRAVIVHAESLLRKVNPNAIKKIWVVGDMGHWGHHVATMVKAEDGGWYVIDNVTGVVKSDQWIQRLTSMGRDSSRPPMIFVTQASRFGPENARVYNTVDLFNQPPSPYNRETDYYSGYFFDYFDWLDTRTVVAPFTDAP